MMFSITTAPQKTITVLKRDIDFQSKSPTSISDVSEPRIIEKFSFLAEGYRHISWALDADNPIVGTSVKRSSLTSEDALRELTNYELEGISVQTSYTSSKNVSIGDTTGQNLKQLITIRNSIHSDRKLTFRTKTRITADRFRWMGAEKLIDSTPITLRATVVNPGEAEARYEGTALSFSAGRRTAVYDWSDVQSLKHDVLVYRDKQSAIVELVLNDLHVPAQSELVIDPNYTMTNTAYSDVTFHGSSQLESLGEGTILGDVNGDGIDDIAILSKSADFNGTNSGSLYLIFGGSVSGQRKLTNTTNFNIRYDGSAGEVITRVLINDVNGDGKDDLIIGSRAIEGDDKTGKLYVIFSTLIDDLGASTGNIQSIGSPSNFNLLINGENSSDQIGDQVFVGDVNGDNQGDLIIGSPRANYNGMNSGSVWIQFSTMLSSFGTSTGNIINLGDTSGWNIRYDGGERQYLSWSGAIITGDLNNDGFSDLVLGAPGASYDGSDSGSAWVIYSTLVDDVGLSTGNIFSLENPNNFNIRYDSAGAQVFDNVHSPGAKIGDINGDGQNDLLLITSYRAGFNFFGYAKYTYVILSSLVQSSGVGTGNIYSLTQSANYNIRYDGGRAGKIGDVNGDGLDDLVLVTPGTSSPNVWVIFSTLVDDYGLSTGNNLSLAVATNYNIRYSEAVVLDDFAKEVEIADFNHDGMEDLLITASRASTGGSTTGHGAVYIMFSTLIDDVGISTGNNKQFNNGTNYNVQYRGVKSDTELTYTATHLSLNTFPEFGVSAISVGDFDGDGGADVFAGAVNASIEGVRSGSAWLIDSARIDDAGITTGNVVTLNAGSFAARFDGERALPEILSGGALAVGDVNGDGIDDVVIGAPYAQSSGLTTGSVFVRFGGGTISGEQDLSNPANFNIRYDGVGDGSLLGIEGALAVSDVNGDGLGDLLIGCKNLNYGTSQTGSVYVMFSTLIDDVGTSTGNIKDLSFGTSYNIRFDGPQAWVKISEYKGIKTGDVNGDGFGDLVLGTQLTTYNGSNSGSVFILLSTLLDDFGVTTGNNLSLSSAANYNLRFDGPAVSSRIAEFGRYDIGDVNGDNHGDLLIGTSYASYNGSNSGSIWVIFSTLIDDIGSSTGNIRSLGAGTNYNIRYDGPSAGSGLSSATIGNADGDGRSDLVLSRGSSFTEFWLITSDLIDDYGISTGNNLSLAVSANYTARYFIKYSSSGGRRIMFGDVNGDNLSDMIWSNSGSSYIMYSTLIDDLTGTTGNEIDIRDPINFNVRLRDSSNQAPEIGSRAAMLIADVNNDNKTDLLIGDEGASNNGTASGSLYYFDSAIFSSLVQATGVEIDFSNIDSYTMRFDGGKGERLLGEESGSGFRANIAVADFDNDNLNDLLVGSSLAKDGGGALYLIFGGDYHRLSGTLTIDGQPIGGATVSLGNLGSVVTDSDGNYIFENLKSGVSYTITPTKLGHTFTPASVSGVVAANTVEDFSATAPRYGISGTVLESGNPVAGVAINGAALGVVYTDQDGFYTFPDLTPGTAYTLRTERAGYLFLPDSITGSVSGDVTHDFLMKPENSMMRYVWGVGGEGSGSSNLQSIAVSPDESVMANGDYSGFVDFDIGTGSVDYHLSSPLGFSDGFGSILTPTGTYQATDTIRINQSSGDAYVLAATSDNAGNKYHGGLISRNAIFNPNGTANLVTLSGSQSGFFSRYNADGSYAWTKVLEGDYSTIISMEFSTTGELYISGSFDGTVDFDPGAGVDNLSSGGSWNAFVSRYAADGSYLETVILQSANSVVFYSMALDQDNNVYLGGWYEGTVDFDPGPGVDSRTSDPNANDMFFSKYSYDLRHQWTHAYGGPDYEIVSSIATYSDTTVCIGGYYYDTVDFDPEAGVDTITSAGDQDIFLSCFGSDGSYRWTRSIGGVDYDESEAIAIGSNQLLYIAGSFSQTANFSTPGSPLEKTSAGGSDIFIATYDLNGTLQGVHTLGGSGWDSANAMVLDANHESIFIGGTYSASFDFNPGSGVDIHTAPGSGYSHFVMKFEPPQTTVTVTGTITYNGAPLSGVTVNAGALGMFTTNGSGQFTISGVVQDSNYSLSFSKSGYAFTPSVISGNATSSLSLNITALSATYVLSGRVVSDTLTPYGIGGVTVDNGLTTVDSDTDGSFSFSGLSPGNYTLHAAKDGFREKQELPLILTGDSFNHEIRLQKDLAKTQYSYWNGYLSSTNILELQNTGYERLSADVTLFDPNGSILGDFLLSVPPYAQKDIIINDIPGFKTNAYGQLRVTFSHENFEGRIVVYRPSLEPRQDGFDFVYALPFSNVNTGVTYTHLNSYYPGLAIGSEVKQWVSVMNTSTDNANYRIVSFSENGQVLDEKIVSVPGHGRRDIDGNIGVSQPRVGYCSIIPLTGGNSYQAMLVRYGLRRNSQLEAKGDVIQYDYALPFVARSGSGHPQYLPTAGNAGRTNWLELTNTLDQSLHVTAEIRDADGVVLATPQILLSARQQMHFHLNDYLTDGQDYGVVILRPDKPDSLIAASAFYFVDEVKGKVDTAYLVQSDEPWGERFISSYNSFLQQNNWIELSNISSERQNITLTINGSSIFPDPFSDVITLSLPPFSSRVVGLHPESTTPVSKNQYGVVLFDFGNPGSVTAGVLRHRIEAGDKDWRHDFTNYIPTK